MDTLERERTDEEVIGMMGDAARAEIGGQELVRKAWEFAREAHAGQRRRSGEPHTEHLFQTAKNLADLGMGPTVIATGLLHDTIEDTGVSRADIAAVFGTEIAFLVEGVTKIKSRRNDPDYDISENLRRLMLAAAKDVRVVIVKLCDRLHNMRTLEFMPPVKREKIALETLEVYVPIADRLGMNDMKRELQDLAFPYAYPKEYKKIRSIYDAELEVSLARVARAKEALVSHFKEMRGMDIEVHLRNKGRYSFYAKYERKGRDIDSIRDIVTLQAVVPDLSDCYAALGTVHALWRPIPGKVKDYIAFPKPNGYRCLRTQVDAGEFGIIEVQLYDEDMYQYSKGGLAYLMSKGGSSYPAAGPRGPLGILLDWLRAGLRNALS